MKFRHLLMPLAAGLALSWLGCGCGKHDVAAEPPIDLSEPVQAQPKLETIQLWLGPERMTAEMALTAEQERTGMMFRTRMGENDGMIFVFPSQRASFWMKNCTLPLSVAYIDPEGVILEIHDMQPHDTNSVVSAAENVHYALETPQGWFARHHVREGMTVRTERGSLAETFRPTR
jgi:uncharacterized membrane protein (UPF0127 family)